MKEKNAKKIGRPPRLLCFLLALFLRPYYKWKYRLRFDAAALKNIKGPALVLASHTCDKDHWLVGMALYRQCPTFVISRHFFAKPKMRPVLSLAHVISKRMFCPDVSTIMNIMRAKRENNVVVLFPEGRLTCQGKTGRITDGTAALAKKMGVDVYVIRPLGASLAFPKWRKAPHPGPITVTASRLFEAKDLCTLGEDEINAKIQAAVMHDDETPSPFRYRSKAPAAGLDGILYRCPSCLGEFTLSSQGNAVTCTCGMRAEMDENYRLLGVPFHSPTEWYEWQSATLSLDVPLSCEATVGAIDANGNMQEKAGRARVSLDRHAFTFHGEVFGRPVAFQKSTDLIAAFPITVGREFDLYHENALYYIYPEPDHRAAVKWVAYLDKVQDEKRGPLPKITNTANDTSAE